MSTTDSRRIAMFKGKRADELTRDELIDAYSRVVSEVERLRQQLLDDAAMASLFTATSLRLRRT